MNAFGTTPITELRAKLNDAKARQAEAVAEAAKVLGPLSEEIAALNNAIFASLEAQARSIYAAGGKAAGDVTMAIDGAGKFKASISKTVSWDNDRLKAVAAKLPWEKTVALFKIDFSVPEAKFSALKDVDPELAGQLTEARTVKYGDLKIVAIDD